MAAFDLAFDSDREDGLYSRIMRKNENFQLEPEELWKALEPKMQSLEFI